MKISTKLTVFILAIVTLIGTTITGYVYYSNLNMLEKEITDRLEDVAIDTMDKIDRNLYERYVDIQMMATDPIISSRNSTPKQIMKRLVEYRNTYKTYISLSFFDLNRIRIADTSNVDIGRQDPHRKYFDDALQGEISAASVIDISFSARVTNIYFASPVRDQNGEIFGVVVARMPIGKLHEITKFTAREHEGHRLKIFGIDLIDETGMLLYSSHNRKGILKDNLFGWEIVKRIKAKAKSELGSLTGLCQIHKEKALFVYAYEQGHLNFKGNNWMLLMHVPTKVAFASAVELKNKLIAVVSAIILIAVLITLIGSRKFTRPISRLQDVAKEIGKGKLDAKIEISSHDEIGDLAESFRKMAKDLKTSMISIDNYEKEIIAREQVEEALKDREEKYRSILENIEDGYFEVDITGNFTFFNDSLCRICGYSNDEMMGMNNKQYTDEENGKKLYQTFNKVYKTGKPEKGFDWDIIRKDGTKRYIEASVSLLKDVGDKPIGFRGIVRDITERKQAEEKFEIQREQIKSLFDYSGEAMALLDLENHIIDANLAFEEVFGYPLEEAHGKVIQDLICPERFYYTEAKELDRQAMQGIKGAEIIRMRKDGKEINVRVSAGPIKVGGAITGRFAVFDDITKRKQAEEASRKVAAFETLSTVLENFIGDSLSNLLTPIYGHIELCEMRDSIDEIKGELGNMKGDITKLLTGINAYRKFTKAGESSLGKISSVDISSILDPFLSGQPFKTYGDKEFPIDPKVKLQFTYNPKQKGSVSWEELPSVSGSKLAVTTTLQETLINAVESYDPKKAGDVVVSAKKEDHNLILEIADKGRGMSNEERDKSQLPFFKVPGVKASGRLGLGAYIALESAKYCGGDIHIESREGIGTTASISFKVSDEVS